MGWPDSRDKRRREDEIASAALITELATQHVAAPGLVVPVFVPARPIAWADRPKLRAYKDLAKARK